MQRIFILDTLQRISFNVFNTYILLSRPYGSCKSLDVSSCFYLIVNFQRNVICKIDGIGRWDNRFFEQTEFIDILFFGTPHFVYTSSSY